MKDDAALTVTGILIQSEIERRNSEAAREQRFRNDELSDANSQLRDQAAVSAKRARALAEDNDDLLDDVQTLNIQMRDLLEKNKGLYEKAVELQKESDYYRLRLAEFMVSEKSFKELAIQYGKQLGKTPWESVKESGPLLFAVLDNKNDEAHRTNIKGSKIVTPEIAEILRKKFSEE